MPPVTPRELFEAMCSTHVIHTRTKKEVEALFATVWGHSPFAYAVIWDSLKMGSHIWFENREMRHTRDITLLPPREIVSFRKLKIAKEKTHV